MNEFFDSQAFRRHVLVVDDEIINREILGSFLSAKFDVTYAGNGQEALALLQAAPETSSGKPKIAEKP